MEHTFRIGPIRPPSEAKSLLLQVTNGCTWNKCKFCNLYKHTKFKAYSADSIKSDIDNMIYWKNEALKYKKSDGSWDLAGINAHLNGLSSMERQCFYMIASWLVNDGDSVFLQDGNTTVLSSGRLSDVLIYLRKAFPNIKRITSYGRAENLSKVSAEEFAKLKEAGLDRIHSGFETGSDEVLKMINKGVTQAQEITAGKNVKAGGIELSVYFMPGVGGAELSESNALGTSHVVNEVKPDFLRIRTAAIKPGTMLYDDYKAGRLALASDEKKLIEIRTIIENSVESDTMIVSDHMINLLEEINGRLYYDKEKLLSIIDKYLSMSREDRKLFEAARRHMHVVYPSDLYKLGAEMIGSLKAITDKYEDGPKWDEVTNEWISRYI